MKYPDEKSNSSREHHIDWSKLKRQGTNLGYTHNNIKVGINYIEKYDMVVAAFAKVLGPNRLSVEEMYGLTIEEVAQYHAKIYN